MSALEDIDVLAVTKDDLDTNPDFDRLRWCISIAIVTRCGQIPHVHPRLHEAVNAAAIELAKAERAAAADDHVEWHVEYADDGDDVEWTKHVRAIGAEAAKAVVDELREADPAHMWRVVRIRVSETVEEW